MRAPRRIAMLTMAGVALAGLGLALVHPAYATTVPSIAADTAAEGLVTATETDAPEGIEEPDPGPSVVADVHYGGSISRAQVLRRAKDWYDRNVPYNQSGYAWDINHGKRYRTDCSGFVSMAWALTTSRTTGSLPDVAHPQSWRWTNSGDMLLRRGHAMLFDKWADSAHTAMWIYEEANTRDDMNHRKISLARVQADGYHPWKYDKIHW